MKNDNIKSFTVLVLICIAVAALMAVVNHFTAPVIAENENKKIQESLTVVMPNGKDFKKIEFSDLPDTVKQVYTEANGGYVFELITTGYGTDLTIICGVNVDGVITGTDCILSNETLGAEDTYKDAFTGANSATLSEIDTISGATLTTGAYKSAISDALTAFEALKGGVN